MKLCILKNNEKFLEVEMYKYRNIYEYKWEKVESAQYAFYVFDNEKNMLLHTIIQHLLQ